jgi:hypothetical protein
MSELKVIGTITTISAIEEAGAGKKLSFRIDTGENFNNLIEFEMYKGADYVEHLNNFIKFNKVGEKVEVEFNLKTYNWKPEADNKIFTSLSCWRVEKVGEAVAVGNEPFPETAPDTGDALPF